MQLSGEQKIHASRQAVWAGLNDPDVLRRSIPGCVSLERLADDRMQAVVEVKIGPIGARFNGAVTLSDLVPPESYTISGEGQGGTVGNAKGGAKVRLTEAADGTLLSYDVEAQVGGRLAQLGGPIIDATAKQLAAKFFRQFGEVVGQPPTAVPEAPAAVAEKPAAAAPLAPSVISMPAAPTASTTPWGWITALALAVVAGFMLGRSGNSEWWMVAMIVMLVVAAAAGYETGRRGGERS